MKTSILKDQYLKRIPHKRISDIENCTIALLHGSMKGFALQSWKNRQVVFKKKLRKLAR